MIISSHKYATLFLEILSCFFSESYPFPGSLILVCFCLFFTSNGPNWPLYSLNVLMGKCKRVTVKLFDESEGEKAPRE